MEQILATESRLRRPLSERAHSKSLDGVLLPEQKMNWQPIEKAPETGADVVGYWPEMIPNHPEREYASVCRKKKWGWVIEVMGDEYECAPPTHWIPLPDPPNSTKESK